MTTIGIEGAAKNLLADLRARFPGSPFLALGQTVFWDEPMKAVLRRLLDESGLGGSMVLGVHDTDYFAKTHLRGDGKGRFVLMPHNDGTTKNLWSAAGEVSTLFGSETFPTRADFVKCDVPFDKVARSSPIGRSAFHDEVTEAWGWRGLVYTGSSDLIVSCLPLRDVSDGILEMIGWGFDNAVTQIGPDCCRSEARRTADRVLEWCRDYRRDHPDAHLTDLFQHLLPRFYQLLLGEDPANVTVAGTSSILRFTPSTAGLSRFKFVNHFLNPATRALAIEAYNEAVSGSTIYTLDKFGAGALPFDIVSPKHGRGTLRVTPRVVFVETRQPIAIGLKRPIESVEDLAEVLNARLGDDITLVGKAVTLVSMLAQEFIFVFNEEGSMYVHRTRKLNDSLALAGVSLDMRPILRMRYSTWDGLAVGTSTLKLPEHLASSFGRSTITTPEFAAQWRDVIAEQRALCNEIASIRRPRDLMAFLQERDPLSAWDERARSYEEALDRLRAIRTSVVEVQACVRERYSALRAVKTRRRACQSEMGEHFRSIGEWTPEATRVREEFVRELAGLDCERRAILAELVDLRSQRHELERGPEATDARKLKSDVEVDLGLARLKIVRHALLTIEGLAHTNHRPSAWWLPLIDSSGGWFNRITQTTELYTEPLIS